jgi:HemY protein
MRTIPALIAIAVLVAVAVLIADQPGRVSILWQGWRIETSAAVLIVGTLAIGLAAAIIFGLLRRLIGGPSAFLRGRRERRRRDGYRALTQGMVAVAAGDPEEAQRYARKADVLLAEPPLTLLLSAQAAQLKGDEDAARKYFAAMLNRPETEFLGLRGLLTQALRRGEETAALRLAERAHTMRPKTPWVLTSLLDLQVRAGEWQNAQATLAEAIKVKLVPVATGRHHQAALLLARSRAAEDDAPSALSLAGEAQDLAPDFAPAAARRAQLLQRTGNRHKAAKTIETAWRRAPHPLSAEVYATLFADEPPLARVKRCERLAALNPNHVESRLVVAQAALAAQLWGEARRQLAAIVSAHGEASPSGEARPSARVCRLMAALEEAEHGDGAAARAWLARAAEAPPDPLWVCKSCGAESRDWQPLCPRCRVFDSLAWQVPTRAVPSLPDTPGDRPVALLPAASAAPAAGKAARWPVATAASAALAGTGAQVDVSRG